MMCSIEELGADRNMYPDAPESGIYLLPEDSVPGDDAVRILGLRDVVFEDYLQPCRLLQRSGNRKRGSRYLPQAFLPAGGYSYGQQ